MDWTKAKTILIIALLITNLFLIIMHGSVKAENQPEEEMLLNETIELLETKNIYVDTELPVKHSKMPILSVEYDRLDPTVLQQQLWTQDQLDKENRSRENILKKTEEFLAKCGIWGPNVELDRLEQNEGITTVYFRNVYQGIPVEDSYIICTVEDGLIKDIDRFWLKPIAFGKTKKATMSASAALINFMSEKNDLESILVEDVKMVYWLDPSNYGSENTISDTAFPAWKITYNDGQIKHIPAYNE